MIKKIVLLGPESTGKSSLCAQLADYYQTAWVKEYAREFLMTRGTGYAYQDLLDIAKGQLVLEDKGIAEVMNHPGNPGDVREKPFLFIDTNMYVLKVWSEFVFGQCHQWILDQVVERKYDLYLLCNIDLPWVRDELREYPDLKTREILYNHYKDILVNQEIPWISISGNYETRLQKAFQAINQMA